MEKTNERVGLLLFGLGPGTILLKRRKGTGFMGENYFGRPPDHYLNKL